MGTFKLSAEQLVYCYTLECNYNMSKLLNTLPEKGYDKRELSREEVGALTLTLPLPLTLTLPLALTSAPRSCTRSGRRTSHPRARAPPRPRWRARGGARR